MLFSGANGTETAHTIDLATIPPGLSEGKMKVAYTNPIFSDLQKHLGGGG